MAGPEVGKIFGEDEASRSANLAGITRDILDDTLYNIIHDIVAKVHREEKTARAASAAIAARQLAEKEAALAQESQAADGTAPSDTSQLSSIKVETDGAVYDGGKIYLKGNPLETTKEILCPSCHLPRLLYPIVGEGARSLDSSKEYCRNHPPVRIPGRDVHGNPWAIEKITKKKKNQPVENNTPVSSPPSSPTSSTQNPFKRLPDKMYVPTTKCPNCPRYFLLTKSAQHLDRCMGISTRQSSRNRTPFENGTPNPPAASRKRGREGEEEAPAPKKRKELNMPAKLKGKKPSVPSKLKNGTTPDMLSSTGSGESTAPKDTVKIKLKQKPKAADTSKESEPK